MLDFSKLDLEKSSPKVRPFILEKDDIRGGSVLDFEVIEASKVDYTDSESSALKA